MNVNQEPKKITHYTTHSPTQKQSQKGKQITNLSVPQVPLAMSTSTPLSQSCSSKADQHRFCVPSTHIWAGEAEKEEEGREENKEIPQE